MQHLAVVLLVALAACGGGGSQRSTPPSTVVVGFPERIPTLSDGECSRPRTDPARPKAGPLGAPTDGVRVERVRVVDGGPDEVVVTFTVSAPPLVETASGERWVVATLSGVRSFGEVAVATPHARRVPATICDDSAWVLALAFDREVRRLELDDDPELTLRVFLG